MSYESVGFVGAGRVVSILLGGLTKADAMPEKVFASDPNERVIEKLLREYPQIKTTTENKRAASHDIVFVAVHPPKVKEVLAEIRPVLKPDAILVSLAPKVSMATLTHMLGGLRSIARIIPNAPSIVGEGYNPVAFSETTPRNRQSDLLKLLEPLGRCPVVDEEKLEAYAILTAMGPTYLWFQLYELCRLGESFGLTEHESREGIAAMASGAAATLSSTGLSPEEVMDLIPLKPLQHKEEDIKQAYNLTLDALFAKLSNRQP